MTQDGDGNGTAMARRRVDRHERPRQHQQVHWTVTQHLVGDIHRRILAGPEWEPAPRSYVLFMRRLMAVSARAHRTVEPSILTGRVQDRNGPGSPIGSWSRGRLVHITICGDRPADIEAQLRFMAGAGCDLIVT